MRLVHLAATICLLFIFPSKRAHANETFEAHYLEKLTVSFLSLTDLSLTGISCYLAYHATEWYSTIVKRY